METTESTQRADAVSRLWEFKRLSDKQSAQGMPFVHFSMLLSDPIYRDGMLAKAEQSKNDSLRKVAGELRALKIRGQLRHAATNGAASASAALAGSNGIHLGGGGDDAGSRMTPWAGRNWAWLAATMGVMLIVGGWWLSQAQSDDKAYEVSESILEDTVWKTGRTYILTGLTFVDSKARLSIEPGVIVRGRPGSALIITRDASIHARGRPDRPVVFTSAQALGQRHSGDWGGVVMLGNAPVNREGHIEGIEQTDSRGGFGGNDEHSSCGVLDYVRIEFAGFEISKDNELNGLTLGGCGRGTIIRHVQVHRSLDDGIEVFGGTVDLQNILITGPGDDAFDWDMGWTGRVQHLIVQMHPDIGDNALEGDNYSREMDAQPRSLPQFFNVTLVNDVEATTKHRAMTVRRGSGVRMHNALLQGFSGDIIDLRDAPVAELVETGVIDFSGVIISGAEKARNEAFPDEDDDDAGFDEAQYFKQGRVEFVASTGLSVDANNIHKPSFTPASITYAKSTTRIPQDEFWNESADYFGAIRPGDRRNWLQGWTAFAVD